MWGHILWQVYSSRREQRQGLCFRCGLKTIQRTKLTTMAALVYYTLDMQRDYPCEVMHDDQQHDIHEHTSDGRDH
jgi:hypothetical protein